MLIDSKHSFRRNASTAFIPFMHMQALKLTVGKAQQFSLMVKSIKVLK